MRTRSPIRHYWLENVIFTQVVSETILKEFSTITFVMQRVKFEMGIQENMLISPRVALSFRPPCYVATSLSHRVVRSILCYFFQVDSSALTFFFITYLLYSETQRSSSTVFKPFLISQEGFTHVRIGGYIWASDEPRCQNNSSRL